MISIQIFNSLYSFQWKLTMEYSIALKKLSFKGRHRKYLCISSSDCMESNLSYKIFAFKLKTLIKNWF